MEASVMSARRKSISVSRTYRHEPDACLRALTIVLEKPVCKEAARSAAPNDGKVRSDEFPVSSIIPKGS